MPGVVTMARPRPARPRPATWAALAVIAAAVVAGCSASPGPSRGTVATCYAFAVQALDRHATVTSVPPSCRGLNHEQINLAVDRAIHAVAGPHRKAVARRLDHREAAYLSYLVTVVPPHVAPAPAATPSTPSSRLPLDFAALAAWVVTVAAGARLLAGWIAHGGLRLHGARVAGVPRVVIVGHFTLALAGLGVWIGFLVSNVTALAWVAVAVVLSVAGLGMATLAGGLPQWHPDAPAGPAADPTSSRPATAGPAAGSSATSGPATAEPATGGPATAAPATAGSATAAPATVGPATARPAGGSATSGSATVAPGTGGPATAAPATAGPATAEPATAGPATAGPAADAAGAAPAAGFAPGAAEFGRAGQAAASSEIAASEPERTAAIGVPAGAPLAFIALHGALAAATILLVVLAAIGTG